MSGHIVYQGVMRTTDNTDDGNGDGDGDGPKLFSGQKLWFAHVVPQRRWLIENAELNGAVVVQMDTEADIRLVDHARKMNAPGTYSYRYVELSIRNGRLEDLASHAIGVGSRVSRPVGSTVTAHKSRRTPFTEEDDQFLWNVVKPFEERGGAWRGNEIYKQIERLNPRHTFQSWRDHWISFTRYHKRTVTELVALPDQQPREPLPQPPETSRRKRLRAVEDNGESQRAENEINQSSSSTQHMRQTLDERLTKAIAEQRSPRWEKTSNLRATPQPADPQLRPPPLVEEEAGPSDRRVLGTPKNRFTREEFIEIYHLIPHLTTMGDDEYDQAMENLADEYNTRSLEEWRNFYQEEVLPRYCRKRGLRLEEVAPYLFEKNEVCCANCLSVTTNIIHYNNEGQRVCEACARFFSTYGVQRTSKMWTEVQMKPDLHKRSTAPATHVAPGDAASVDVTAIAPATPRSSSRVNRQVEQLSPTFPAERTAPSQPTYSENRQRSRRLNSSSSQPASPNQSRPPEPNEARKRTPGKGSQSQSTQDSLQLGPESQTQTQLLDSQESFAAMDDVLSRGSESDTQDGRKAVKRKVTVEVPLFRPSPKGKRKRSREDPRVPRPREDFSSPAGLDPPPAMHDRTAEPDSDKENRPSSSAPQTMAARRSRRAQRDPSPLFVPEDDEDEDDEEIQRPDPSDPYEEQMTSPLGVDLLSDEQWDDIAQRPVTLHEESEEESELDSELDDADLPRREQFETAQETLEDYETAPVQQSAQPTHGRIPTPVLYSQLRNDPDVLYPDLSVREPEGGWRVAFGGTPPPLPEENEDSEGLEEIQDDSEIQIKREASSDFELPPSTQPSLAPLPATEEPDESPPKAVLDMQEFISHHEALYPAMPELGAILQQALEATMFDFQLSFEVVRLMIEKQRSLPRRGGSRMSSAAFDADAQNLLPTNMRGVWTEEDDRLLMSLDKRDVQRMLHKHGREGCNVRLDHFNYQAPS